jgi:hypothetical protein
MRAKTDVVNLGGRVVTSEDSLDFGFNLTGKAITILSGCRDNSEADYTKPVQGAFAHIPKLDMLELGQILEALAGSILATMQAVTDGRLSGMYITSGLIHGRWKVIVDALIAFHDWKVALLTDYHAASGRKFDSSEMPKYIEAAEQLAQMFQPQP